MATVGDSTDPKGTKQPNKNPIIVSTHIFKPAIIAERLSKIYLPLNISFDNIYGIFSLFVINDVLEMLAKNTNKYVSQRYKELQLKAS